MAEVGQPSRRLLVTASTNQADVNFQFLAFTTANVPVVQAELANVIKNSTGTDNALPVSLACCSCLIVGHMNDHFTLPQWHLDVQLSQLWLAHSMLW